MPQEKQKRPADVPGRSTAASSDINSAGGVAGGAAGQSGPPVGTTGGAPDILHGTAGITGLGAEGRSSAPEIAGADSGPVVQDPRHLTPPGPGLADDLADPARASAAGDSGGARDARTAGGALGTSGTAAGDEGTPGGGADLHHPYRPAPGVPAPGTTIPDQGKDRNAGRGGPVPGRRGP